MSAELSAVVFAAAAITLNTLYFRATGRRRPFFPHSRPSEPEAVPWAAFALAWIGLGCAALAVIGHMSDAGDDRLWFALMGAAVITVPLAAARAMRSEPEKRPRTSAEEDDD